jgi:hypothetical protein
MHSLKLGDIGVFFLKGRLRHYSQSIQGNGWRAHLNPSNWGRDLLIESNSNEADWKEEEIQRERDLMRKRIG